MPLVYSVLLAGLGSKVEEFLVPVLDEQGYSVSTAVGLDSILQTLNHSIDLVLLDLPQRDDLAHLGELRAACPSALVVIGPARDDKLLVTALELGADDYVQRPFRTDELLARVRAQLRRRQRAGPLPLVVGELHLDLGGRVASYGGRPLDLSPEEFTLLAALAARPGYASPARDLAQLVWGRARRDDGALLADTVARLRALIEPDPLAPSTLGGSLQSGFWLGQISQEREINGEG